VKNELEERTVKNTTALANPEALDYFKELKELDS